LSVIVAVFPAQVGGLARLSLVLSVGWAPLPNQYSGRYIMFANSLALMTLM
jgi:hypothetical protein